MKLPSPIEITITDQNSGGSSRICENGGRSQGSVADLEFFFWLVGKCHDAAPALKRVGQPGGGGGGTPPHFSPFISFFFGGGEFTLFNIQVAV